MADATVKAIFAADSTSLERAFSKAGTGAKSMAADFDKAEGKTKSFSSAMDRTTESVGNSEGKFMGAADLLDGLGGAFGLPTEGATSMFRAFGDLSGGFEVVGGLFTKVIGKLGILTGATAAEAVATEGATAAQTSLNLALLANPVGLVIAGLVALGVALFVAWNKSETFRNIVKGAFSAVGDAIGWVVGAVGDLAGKFWTVAGAIKDAILWPYKTAFNLISDLWNHTVGAVGFDIPSWVPVVGGKGWHFPSMPRFHTGGIVGQGMTPGAEVPILAMAGETVSPAGAGGGTTVIQLVLDGRVITEVVHSGLLAKQRRTPLGLVS